MVGTGRVGTLRQPYFHYVFSKGLDEWLARHERYARDEALQNLRELERGTVGVKFLREESEQREIPAERLADFLAGLEAS